MANFKVKTTVVVDRNPVGSTIELPKLTAEKLADKKYVEIIGEVKPAKKTPAPKKPAKKAAAKTTPKKTQTKAETK